MNGDTDRAARSGARRRRRRGVSHPAGRSFSRSRLRCAHRTRRRRSDPLGAPATAPEFAVVDLRMPDASGLEVVRELHEIDPSSVIVMLTGYGSIATAVEAVRLGAVQYLEQARRHRSDPGRLRRQERSAPAPLPCRAWRVSNGSTFSASSVTAMATSPKPRACSAFIVARCNASCPRIRYGAEHFANVFQHLSQRNQAVKAVIRSRPMRPSRLEGLLVRLGEFQNKRPLVVVLLVLLTLVPTDFWRHG